MATNNSTEIVFEPPWFNIEREYFDDQKSPDGKPFYRLITRDGMMILAITDADEIVMVGQFRPAFKQVTRELPAGCVEKNEDPRGTASENCMRRPDSVVRRFGLWGQAES